MHDLPRQLTVDELAELFEGRTRLVEKLAERDDPLVGAEVIAGLSEEEKLEALNAHPAIGAKQLSARSAAEQGGGADPETLPSSRSSTRSTRSGSASASSCSSTAARRARSSPVLRERLERTREEELDTAVKELVAIAEDRWRRS